MRFYSEGAPAHIGPQPPILVDASDLLLPTGRRRMQSVTSLFSVVTTASGDEPAGFSVANEAELEAVETVGTNASTTAEAVSFVAPVHICGDGVRTTAEACDDNNTIGGDGCDALCRV